MLTQTQIERLAGGKGVQATAVINFLTSLGSEGATGRGGAMLNLAADAKAYRWRAATIAAIRIGIGNHFRPSR